MLGIVLETRSLSLVREKEKYSKRIIGINSAVITEDAVRKLKWAY